MSPITKDRDRLAKVASELGAAIAEAQRTGRVTLPVIQPRDAAGFVMAMNEAFDAAIDERSREAAADGLHIACSAGCSACCVSPVLVSEGEAVTVAEWLSLPENAPVRARFYKKYKAWKAGVGEVADMFAAAKTPEQKRDAAIAFKHKGVMCAFNHEGLCTIYEPRPARCRRAHALETSSNCGADGTGEVKYFEHPRTEMTFQEQEPLRAALHHALRPNANVELLCNAVFRLLDAKLARNDACPCGSGKKYKRCCGA